MNFSAICDLWTIVTIVNCEQSASLTTIPVCLQRRRLAGLPGGVQHKVAALLDDAHDARQPFKCREHVVLVREARPRNNTAPRC